MMMRLMRGAALLLGVLLIAGEVARAFAGAGAGWKAADDLAAGAALLALGVAGARAGAAWHAAGWALFTGVMLATLGINLEAWATDATKPRAGAYAAVLALFTAWGGWASLWWARRG